jgi:large subunit ribosomal protein L17
LLTKSKDDSTHSRRVVFSYLQNNDAVTELFREVSPKITNRPGGYTRILKTGIRAGDSADMCIIELVDYNENLLSAKQDSKTAAVHRRRRGGKKKDGEVSSKAQAVPEVVTGESEIIEPEVSDTIVNEEAVDEDNKDISDEKKKE